MQNNTLDILHRRYIAYLESAENDAETEKLLSEILRADSDSERFDTAIYTCEIKTDWLERIEHSLEHLDRAVRENRQFILRQGETVPIEKVRRVSKTSVEHLARHSEYITREPEEDTGVIPEKLLMTENVGTLCCGNFAVVDSIAHQLLPKKDSKVVGTGLKCAVPQETVV